MITIYHLNTSRSERVIWLMEELGLPYKLEKFQREPTMLAPASLSEIHPLGKAPIIRDGDVVLIESGAIIEYVIQRHGGGKLSVPVASADYPRYLQWMHFAEGSAMSQLLLQMFLGLSGLDASSPLVAMVKQRTEGLLQFLDSELGNRPYFAGQAFTAADIMMVFPFGMAGFVARPDQPRGPGLPLHSLLQLDVSPYANIRSYMERIGKRPAYQKAMAIANPV
jgi:glutathione S-transferase